MSKGICEHIEAVDQLLDPKGYECEECVKVGGRWVHRCSGGGQVCGE